MNFATEFVVYSRRRIDYVEYINNYYLWSFVPHHWYLRFPEETVVKKQ